MAVAPAAAWRTVAELPQRLLDFNEWRLGTNTEALQFFNADADEANQLTVGIFPPVQERHEELRGLFFQDTRVTRWRLRLSLSRREDRCRPQWAIRPSTVTRPHERITDALHRNVAAPAA